MEFQSSEATGARTTRHQPHEPMSHSDAVGPTRQQFRPDIEGLRAVAILLVVTFHVGIPLSPGGFIGVDVFFVISGYLITGLLVHELEQTGRLRLANFYARRIRRLLPASAAMVLATLLVGYLLVSPIEWVDHTRAALAAAVYMSNIWFQRQAADYFAADSSQNPFLHAWSLSVEEQFYLLWPIIIVLTYRQFRSRRVLAAVMFAFSVASFGLCLQLLGTHQPVAFFSSPTRAWEFGIGGVLSLIAQSPLHRRPTWNRLAGVLGLAMIAASTMLITRSSGFPGTLTLLPVLGTELVLVSGASDAKSGAGSFLGVPVMQRLGALSYSWYLWHWPILVLAAAVIPSITLAQRAILAILTLAIAAASHAFLENPIRFNPYLVLRPRATLVVGAAITMLSVGLTRTAKVAAATGARTPEQRAITEAADSPWVATSGCFLDRPAEDPPPCVFGDTNSSKTIALFGDSHAAMWFPAFQAAAAQNGWRLLVFTKMQCPSLIVYVTLWPRSDPYSHCLNWRATVMQRLLQIKPAVVILANSDAWVSWAPPERVVRVSREAWRNGLRTTLTTLAAAGMRTIVLRDTPGFQFNVLRCLSRALGRHRSPDACAAPRNEVVREDVYAAARSAVAGLANASTLDLIDYFCDPNACPVMRNGIVAFKDARHISEHYALSLGPVIAQKVAMVGVGSPTATIDSGARR